MTRAMRKIEVDEATATALAEPAAERGVTISELVSQLVVGEPVQLEPAELEELRRRWTSVEESAGTVANDDVVRWLETWGTPAFRPWHDR